MSTYVSRVIRILAVASLLLTGRICSAGELKALLAPLIEAHQGKVAIAIKHLETSETFDHRADEPMPTASLIKFPVMAEAYRQAEQGRVELEGLIALREDDKVPGSGILTTHLSAGTKLSLRDAIRLMIAYSDNTATNLTLEAIGIRSTAEFMESLGMPNTKIHAKVFRRESSVFPQRSREFGLGSTTAAETLRLYELLHQRKLVSAAASDKMRDHLLHCTDDEKMARLLPPGTKVAHKGGAVSRARCDAGIIYSPSGPLVVCVMTSENEDRGWQPENAGSRLCADVARVAFEHFNPKGDKRAVTSVLRVGSSGRFVETLQRTLNARLKPSPDLSIDGDFGSVTQAAVQRFQKEHSLATTGAVGPDTWQALGTLITAAPPVPEPSVVNGQKLTTQPADPITGSPFVTCKAWAIADAGTGELLWGDEEETKLDFASTTKIMTAYLVLKLTEQKPGILEEEIVFSERADGTPGSTAGVRAGERLSVAECLYGLLLPSGNDASVALAEHFGNRFAADGTPRDSGAAYSRFVDQMNGTAKDLGMTATTYVNPHGLTAEGHVSTARDLLRLAHAAMQLSSFRAYVGTRQRGCKLVGPGGYRRNVVWNNTNRLLGISGYAGLKTGTTSAAGACLVSSAARDDEELLMVILGAKSSTA
ncbi:MAG: hypothetical protein CMJ48_10050, partial [Planctomycetaceae bacterium]|nr:hypothetical protein [Planctomycetaceae bacterium]